MMERISRRGLLKKSAACAAIVTAATTLPAPVAAIEPGEQPAPGELVHDALCFHRKYRVVTNDARRHELEGYFQRILSESDHRLFSELSNLDTNDMVDEQDVFVDEMIRHLPGLAPVIRMLAYHLGERDLKDNGSCCSVWQNTMGHAYGINREG
jgi:hypothetical protein